MNLFHKKKKTLQDYLEPDSMGWTPLHYAAFNGSLDRVMKELEASGEKLTPDHFLTEREGNQGQNVLCEAACGRHLDQVFNPSYWKNRVGEMMKLWDKVPENIKEDFDFKGALEKTVLLSVQNATKLDVEAMSQAIRPNASPADQLADNGLSR